MCPFSRTCSTSSSPALSTWAPPAACDGSVVHPHETEALDGQRPGDAVRAVARPALLGLEGGTRASRVRTVETGRAVVERDVLGHQRQLQVPDAVRVGLAEPHL